MPDLNEDTWLHVFSFIPHDRIPIVNRVCLHAARSFRYRKAELSVHLLQGEGQSPHITHLLQPHVRRYIQRLAISMNTVEPIDPELNSKILTFISNLASNTSITILEITFTEYHTFPKLDADFITAIYRALGSSLHSLVLRNLTSASALHVLESSPLGKIEHLTLHWENNGPRPARTPTIFAIANAYSASLQSLTLSGPELSSMLNLGTRDLKHFPLLENLSLNTDISLSMTPSLDANLIFAFLDRLKGSGTTERPITRFECPLPVDRQRIKSCPLLSHVRTLSMIKSRSVDERQLDSPPLFQFIHPYVSTLTDLSLMQGPALTFDLVDLLRHFPSHCRLLKLKLWMNCISPQLFHYLSVHCKSLVEVDIRTHGVIADIVSDYGGAMNWRNSVSRTMHFKGFVDHIGRFKLANWRLGFMKLAFDDDSYTGKDFSPIRDLIPHLEELLVDHGGISMCVV